MLSAACLSSALCGRPRRPCRRPSSGVVGAGRAPVLRRARVLPADHARAERDRRKPLRQVRELCVDGLWRRVGRQLFAIGCVVAGVVVARRNSSALHRCVSACVVFVCLAGARCWRRARSSRFIAALRWSRRFWSIAGSLAARGRLGWLLFSASRAAALRLMLFRACCGVARQSYWKCALALRFFVQRAGGFETCAQIKTAYNCWNASSHPESDNYFLCSSSVADRSRLYLLI